MKTKCMSCGGSMKKMAKGGSMKTTVGKATPKGQIYGIPQTGPTGPNYQGVNTMQKGGAVKKMQDGGKTGAQLKKEGAAMKLKGEGMKLKGQGQAMKAQGKAMKADGIKQKEVGTYIKNNPIRAKVDKALIGEYLVKQDVPFKKGGMVKKTKFSALAPPYNKATFADKIVGAKKNASKKK